MMEYTMKKATCPECGRSVDERSMILECEYCLSKKED
ncbi:YhfH family protein [Virgibacillus alimentarius]|uniref:Zn finger protein HypA/HybF involved in hydrogenase expression n=1 Tax=Virgibacillus alimentarius TaxID=698769 RepID=A0ABS4S8U2_9BACI|nr:MULTISPECIES: YhfH family protein [Virgibacillus]MBP2257908.1 Zn finger protein HypA/HybF involved in hydrogenase expression [Virgibacillus alimentarius]HLR69477.1 YhfH family protein [Virgibacillus sp.]